MKDHSADFIPTQSFLSDQAEIVSPQNPTDTLGYSSLGGHELDTEALYRVVDKEMLSTLDAQISSEDMNWAHNVLAKAVLGNISVGAISYTRLWVEIVFRAKMAPLTDDLAVANQIAQYFVDRIEERSERVLQEEHRRINSQRPPDKS